MTVAIITGASRGLGKALATGLARRGWSLVLDARGEDALRDTENEIRPLMAAGADVRGVVGDVTDPQHRRTLVDRARALGGLDLLVNNASTLGRSPLPRVADLDPETLARILAVNTIAPVALIHDALPLLRRAADPRVLAVTSDASVEHYESWGGYGSSKAALDHLSATLAVEEPALRVWTVDPGDMRTVMHQDAFPGEDISDRPLPESVVPALLELIDGPARSGRQRISEPAPTGGAS
ncbi:MAG: SDR family NAD(P)-dependent oxidoreductase [Acidimicrobiales bacterium]